MIAVSYIMKRKIKKIFFEVISNSKIFNIIFFNEMVNDQNFPKLTGGLDNVEYGISKKTPLSAIHFMIDIIHLKNIIFN